MQTLSTKSNSLQVIQHLDNGKVRLYEATLDKDDHNGLVTVELNGKYDEVITN